MTPDPSQGPRRTLDPDLPDDSPNPQTIDATRESTGATGPYVPAASAAPPEIPGYAITAEIARGGMGRVYAGRELTLDREVAIKTLLPGADAERFVVEAKITAKLPHPGIPPVHALGTLADGSPYLAMKRIGGRTLAELLKERPSPAHELPRFVQIFEQIAQAVGFAHTQGIIHRDLKPLNVMVGAFGEVQVMDWGLAKDVGARSVSEGAEPTLADASGSVEATRAGSILGTPGYMAPEQARGEVVDAGADVFALGSILATILTGQPAFVGTSRMETIQKAAKAELADVLGRLDASGADTELIGLARHCLSARSGDRPGDARAVAEKVAAYRAGVEARLHQAETERAEALVRAAEQTKRRRVMQWAGGAIAAVLLLGVVGTTIGLLRANRAAAAEKEANDQTKRRLAQIETGVELFAGMLTGINPRAEELGGDPIYVQLLKRAEQAADQLDAEAVGDPLAVARLQTLLGRTLKNLGSYAKAIEVLEKACATRERELRADHPDTLASRNNLAGAYESAGQLDKALPLFEATLKAREANLGADHPDTLTFRSNLANAYHVAGQLDKALPLLQATLDASEAKLGADHPATLTSRNNLAMAYKSAGQLDKALPLLEATLKVQEAKLGADHPATLISRNNLAEAYNAAGQLDKALPLYEATLKAQEAKLGADHPGTLVARDNLASAYTTAGQPDKALPLFEVTLKIFEAKLGADHPDTLVSRNNLAMTYKAAGQLDKALPLLEATLKAREAKLGADHPNTLTSRGNLALAYHVAGQLDKALPLLEATLKAQEAKLGADHPNTLISRNNLALAYHVAGQLDKALPLYEATLKAKEAKLGADHPETLTSRSNLASAYQSAGQLDRALPLFEEAAAGIEKLRFQHANAGRIIGNTISAFEKAGLLDKAEGWRRKWLAHVRRKAGAPSPAYAVELARLGSNLLKQKKWAEAEPVLSECVTIREKNEPEAWTTFNTMSMLGEAILGQKKYADAEPVLLKGYEGIKARADKIPPQFKDVRLREAIERLMRLYEALDRKDDVAKWRQVLPAAKK
jgi:tetratricopeptide (TPR) repeat protein